MSSLLNSKKENKNSSVAVYLRIHLGVDCGVICSEMRVQADRVVKTEWRSE